MPWPVKIVLKIMLGLLIVLGALFVLNFHFQNFPWCKYVSIRDDSRENPLKIVQITDIHYNTTFPPVIDDMIKKVNKENPDIVVFTGDFVTYPGKLSPKFISKMKQIKGKKYCVFGNHDSFDRKKALKDMGMESVSGKFISLGNNWYLSGVDFEKPVNVGKSFKNPSYEKLKELLIKQPGNCIYLYHCPQDILKYKIKDYVMKDKKTLFLCGHTHGGQIVFPWEKKYNFILTREAAIKKLGIDFLSESAKAMAGKVYICGGIGSGNIRFRYGAKPEIYVYKIEPLK